ncbi:hypothetical protein BGZ82_003016 [Podila clonocystis]|nr:hypothetical protein BGZ82_003016 [Podila clonocystis]
MDESVSAAMDSYAMKGWTLLNDGCPDCNTPLMRNQEATSQVCVNCEINPPVDSDDEEGQKPAEHPWSHSPVSSHRPTSLGSGSYGSFKKDLSMALWTNHWNDRSRTHVTYGHFTFLYGTSIPNIEIIHTFAQSTKDAFSSTSSRVCFSANNTTLSSTHDSSG